MAKYIDKYDLIRFFNRFKEPIRPITEGFKFLSVDDVIKVVAERPTADVVEQKKIDNAIEEMQRYSDGFHYIGKRDLENVVENCIRILKRNIGD